jgi:glucokinase
MDASPNDSSNDRSGEGPRRHEGAGDAVYIGVDIGGTKVMAAAVADDGEVGPIARRETPGRRVEVALVEDALTEAVQEAAAGRAIAAVGVAAAGFVDAAGERVMFAPHLPWRDDPTRSRLEARWNVPVLLDNDANCAARAELALGTAREAADVLMITMGTGIGGAVVLGGTLLRGRNGMAGEFGHMQVVPDGRGCECGGEGCWEQYSSGNALVRYARGRLLQSYAGTSLLDEATGGAPAILTGPMVTDAARRGDRLALEAFDEVGTWLGVGIANLVAAFDPELVVVGGGVSAADDLLLEPARVALEQSLVGAGHRLIPAIVRARFGPEAGVVGAATLARAVG